MELNLEQIAEELFGKLRTQFPQLQLGNANNQVTDVPKDARFFEFDFVKKGQNLGTVTVDISEDDGLVVIYSNDITDQQPSGVTTQWYNFLKELREFAKQNRMKFSARDTTKSNLDKRDYDYLAKKHGEAAMTESKLWGTSKTSFQDIGEAKLIVKHSKPVNYDLPAGRTMHIESIYVENVEGERFKYPYRHLNGARALAMHVAHGGTSYDTIGQHIIGLSEELNKLRMFKGYVDRNPVVSEAMGTINGKVYERIDQVKKEIHSLQNANYYKTFAESWSDPEDVVIPEELVNDWVDRLTIRSFNEELKNVFPYIYKLVGEDVAPVKEIMPSDLFTDVEEETQYDPVKEIDELVNYEAYLNQLVGESNDLFANNPEAQSSALQKLNQLMAQEMPGGADGTNAIQSLKGIIDDPELAKALKFVSALDPEGDVRDIVMKYLQGKDEENGTDFSTKVTFNPSAQPAPAAPAEPAAPEVPATPVGGAPATPEPAAPVPVAERFIKAIERAKAAGATMNTMINLGGKEISLGEAAKLAGLNPEEYFMEDSVSSKQEEVVEFIKSMYDEQSGSFPKGETGVLIAVEKQFGEDVTELASTVIKELSAIYESNQIRKLAGLGEQQMPPMMDPDAIMQQQMQQMMQRNPKLQNIDPAKMSANLHQRVQQMQQQNKAQQATLKPGEEVYKVNGKPVSKAEYDAFMAKNPQLANPAANPELARIKKMAGMPADDGWGGTPMNAPRTAPAQKGDDW